MRCVVTTLVDTNQLSPMLEMAIYWSAKVIEVVGVAIIVVGAFVATALFVRQLVGGGKFQEAYLPYRSNLGRAILLGLEFLVAADIIGTVAVDPTFRSLGVLGLIVLIRTFLSFALEVEINGQWPWSGGEARKNE
jgi:uncharacterized membrane protein